MRIATITVFSKSEVETLRNLFPQGSTVKLDKLNDEHARIKSGTYGTVKTVDDFGTIQVKWANGVECGVIPFVDSFERVE